MENYTPSTIYDEENGGAFSVEVQVTIRNNGYVNDFIPNSSDFILTAGNSGMGLHHNFMPQMNRTRSTFLTVKHMMELWYFS
jgi:hypothetical protein